MMNLTPNDLEFLVSALSPVIEKSVQNVLTKHSADALDRSSARSMSDTLSDFADYIRNEKGLRVNTSSTYCSDVRQLSAHLLLSNERPAMTSDFTKEAFLSFVRSQRASGIAENSISRRFQGLLSYSTFLHSKGLAATIFTHESMGICFKRRDKMQRYLTPEEFKKLLIEAAFEPESRAVRNWALLNFLYLEGMSISMALRLNRVDVNLQTGTIHLKSRTRVLKSQTISVLSRYLNDSLTPDMPLFPSKNGRHLHPSNYREKIAKPTLARLVPDYKIESLHPSNWPKSVCDQILKTPETNHD